MALSLKSYCCWCLRGGGGGDCPTLPPPFKQKMLIFFPTRVTRGVLLVILGGDVSPGSPNLDPISHLFSDLESKIHTHFKTWNRSKLCHHYLD